MIGAHEKEFYVAKLVYECISCFLVILLRMWVVADH